MKPIKSSREALSQNAMHFIRRKRPNNFIGLETVPDYGRGHCQIFLKMTISSSPPRKRANHVFRTHAVSPERSQLGWDQQVSPAAGWSGPNLTCAEQTLNTPSTYLTSCNLFSWPKRCLLEKHGTMTKVFHTLGNDLRKGLSAEPEKKRRPFRSH